MDISVVLCTWNNCARLRKTLESFEALQLPAGTPWELIIVNNNCTDSTDEVTSGFRTHLPIIALTEKRQGLSRARNAGLAASKGALVVFTDDDVCPCVGWLQVYQRAFSERPKGFFFGGPIESEFEGAPPDPALLAHAPASVKGLSYGAQVRELGEFEELLSANWACPRSALVEAGGFDENLGLDPSSGMVRVGEETALMSRLRERGMHALYLPDAAIRHFVPAEKCRARHIGDRLAASAYNYGFGEFAELGTPGARRLPRYLHGITIARLRQWLWARARGRNGYDEYMEYRRHLGYVAGFRDAMLKSREAEGTGSTGRSAGEGAAD